MRYRVVVAAALTTSFFACSPPTASPPSTGAVRAEIAQRWTDYVEAARARDPDALIHIWAPDMRLLSDPGGAEDIRSAEEHRDLAAAAFPSLTVASLSVESDEVILLGDSAAIEVGKWSEVLEVEGSTEPVSMFGAYLGV